MVGLNFTAIDFETANNYRSSACSIGLAVVENGTIIDRYYKLIKPEPLEVGHWQKQIHGLSIDDLLDQPIFSELWHEIEPYIKDRVLVAHNASFDKSVLYHLHDHYNLDKNEFEFFCTYKASKITWPTELRHTLSHISYRLGFDHQHHHALSDAEAASKIAIEIARRHEQSNLSELNYQFHKLSFAPKKRTNLQAALKLTDLEVKEDIEHPFYHKTVVFTGKMDKMPRNIAEIEVQKVGGIFSDRLTTQTNVLVVGGYDNNLYGDSYLSGKAKKALEYKMKGVPIEMMTEIDFYQILGI